MTQDEIRLAVARRQSDAARARLTGTLVELQKRLKPKALIEDALEDIREKADELTDDAIDAIKQRPFTAAAIGIAMIAWLFRAPLFALFASLFGRRETEDGDES